MSSRFWQWNMKGLQTACTKKEIVLLTKKAAMLREIETEQTMIPHLNVNENCQTIVAVRAQVAD